MQTRFELTIDLDNDAMQSNEDVAEALRHVALRLSTTGFPEEKRAILDENGNTVGSFSLRRRKASR